MIILGIDPGTRITGYGLIKVLGNNITCIEYGVIKNPTKLNSWECQLRIADGIAKIVQEYKIDSVAVESQFFYKNARAALKIGEARSVALLAATRAGLSISEYTPTRVKKAVVGHGAARKEQVQVMVRSILNLKEVITSEDASDALAIAICHYHEHKINQLLK